MKFANCQRSFSSSFLASKKMCDINGSYGVMDFIHKLSFDAKSLFLLRVKKNTTCVRHLLFHLAIRSSCKRSRNKESIYQTPFYKSCTNFLHRAFLSFRWQFTFVITVRNRQLVPSKCRKRNSFDREC